MDTGVYKIICRPTGRVYIGSTGWSLSKRWAKHRRDLRAGKHHSPRLQHAWNKYGEDAFDFRVIQHASGPQALLIEQILIDELRPEFNVNRLATSSLGTKRTPEQRERYAEAARRRHAEGRGATAALVAHNKSDAHRSRMREVARKNQPAAAAARRKDK